MGKGPQTSLQEGSEGVITSISLHPGRTTLPLSWAEERKAICLKDGLIRVLPLSEENFWLPVLFHSEVLCRCLPLQPCSGTPSLSSECVSVSVPSPPSSLPGGPAATTLSPSPIGVLLTASFPHS